MKKPKLRRRICASYSKLKDLLKTHLASSVSTSDTTSIQHRFSRIFTPAQDNERYARKVEISFRHGETPFPSKYTKGMVLFDTQSRHNLVTFQFLDNNGIEWQRSISNTRMVQMDGREIQCLGEIEGRWFPVDPLKDDNFRPRYEISTFRIVDSEEFEMIIGSITINEIGLFQLNRAFFGAFRQLPIRVDSATALKKQQEAEERRKKEQEEMKKFEEEQARKAKASKA